MSKRPRPAPPTDAELLEYAALSWPQWKAGMNLALPSHTTTAKMVAWIGRYLIQQNDPEELRVFVNVFGAARCQQNILRDLAQYALKNKASHRITAHLLSAMFHVQYKGEVNQASDVLRKMASHPEVIEDLLQVARMACDPKCVDHPMAQAVLDRNLLLGALHDVSGACWRAVVDDFQSTQWNKDWHWGVQVDAMISKLCSTKANAIQKTFRQWVVHLPAEHEQALWSGLMGSRYFSDFPKAVHNYLAQHITPERALNQLEHVIARHKHRVYDRHLQVVQESEMLSGYVFTVLLEHVKDHDLVDVDNIMRLQQKMSPQQDKWKMEETTSLWNALNAHFQHVVLHAHVPEASASPIKRKM